MTLLYKLEFRENASKISETYFTSSKKLPSPCVLIETEKLPLIIITAIRMIKYWNRLTEMTDSCLAKLVLYDIETLMTIALTENVVLNIY